MHIQGQDQTEELVASKTTTNSTSSTLGMDFGPTYRKVYLKSGEFKMRVSVTSNELVNKDIELNAAITMKINAKAL